MAIYKKPKLLPSKPRSRSPRAIDDLAVLPIFYKLKGRKVLLAGGTAAAAWKADLLAASGAIVHVFAMELGPEFAALLSGPRGKKFVHHTRPWALDSFENAAVAIADIESKGEAKAFYCSAKAAGVPVNVIDQPSFCEFQFGSIVNRSPAIVSISTDGAAPILGQAIRQRIETLLPASLKQWAEYAHKIRSEVTERLKPGQERRNFWERFSVSAFTQSFSNENARVNFNDMDALSRSSQTGKVTLVGAGPGDAELLILKAVRALQAADVILFDDLVSDDVLELARREAKKMLVGKRGGRTSCKQEDINDMMVNLALAGKNVVRLKSGDPVIFGRAGEEISALRERSIPVSIIPGITAASAMAAQLGISLTHRDHAQSVRFVTGHSRAGKLPDEVNWRAIADPTTSTVFYMGGRTAKQIKAKLTEHGLSEETPAVICADLTRSTQCRWNGPLSDLDYGIDRIGFDQPVLIGIGSAFGKISQRDIGSSEQDLVSRSRMVG